MAGGLEAGRKWGGVGDRFFSQAECTEKLGGSGTWKIPTSVPTVRNSFPEQTLSVSAVPGTQARLDGDLERSGR